MKRTRLALVSLVALGSLSLAAPSAAVAAARPAPGYVELQGHELYDQPIGVDAHVHLYGITFLKNIQNIAGWQVVFTVDYNSTSADPAPYVVQVARSQYPKNPAAAFQQSTPIPLDATSVTITATLQHVNRKGVVDQTLTSLAGTGTIVPVAQLTELNLQLFCITPTGDCSSS